MLDFLVGVILSINVVYKSAQCCDIDSPLNEFSLSCIFPNLGALLLVDRDTDSAGSLAGPIPMTNYISLSDEKIP